MSKLDDIKFDLPSSVQVQLKPGQALPKPPPWMRRDYSEQLEIMEVVLATDEDKPHFLTGFSTKGSANARRLDFYKARSKHKRVDNIVPDKYDRLEFRVAETNVGWAVVIEKIPEVNLTQDVQEVYRHKAIEKKDPLAFQISVGLKFINFNWLKNKQATTEDQLRRRLSAEVHPTYLDQVILRIAALVTVEGTKPNRLFTPNTIQSA